MTRHLAPRTAAHALTVAALLAFASCSAGDEESLLQSADPASGTGETATTIGATTGVEPSRLAPEATQTTQIGNGDDREAAGASPEASSSTTAPTSAGEALPATETTTTAAVQTTTAPLSPLYLVDTYDPGRDPAADLDNALRVARAEDRLVILIVGGDWCPDCFTLDAFIAGDTERASRLQSEAALVKVNISAENENQAFLSTFPAFEWVPHLYVVDASGSLLLSYDTRGLMTGGAFDDAKFDQFLNGL